MQRCQDASQEVAAGSHPLHPSNEPPLCNSCGIAFPERRKYDEPSAFHEAERHTQTDDCDVRRAYLVESRCCTSNLAREHRSSEKDLSLHDETVCTSGLYNEP